MVESGIRVGSQMEKRNCPVCKVRVGRVLGWYAGPQCDPRGLRLICSSCREAAESRTVPDYLFYSAPSTEAARLLEELCWQASDRQLLLSLLN